MLEIEPHTKICEILEAYEEAKEVFTKLGYKCVDCAVNIEDTLLIAAKYHNKDINELLNSLREIQQKNMSNK